MAAAGHRPILFGPRGPLSKNSGELAAPSCDQRGPADNLDDLLSNREQLNQGLELMIDSPALGWGIHIDRVEIKDVIAALQLRLLETVVAVAAEKNSTLILPFPVELLRFLDRAARPDNATPLPKLKQND